jgi:hypothetical protein
MTNNKEAIIILNGTMGMFAGANSIAFSKSPGQRYLDEIVNSPKYDTCLLSEFVNAVMTLGRERVGEELTQLAVYFNHLNNTGETIQEKFRGKWGEVYRNLPDDIKEAINERFDPNLKEALNQLGRFANSPLDELNEKIQNILTNEFNKMFKGTQLEKGLGAIRKVFSGIRTPIGTSKQALRNQLTSLIDIENTYISGAKKSMKKTNTLRKKTKKLKRF